MIARTLNWIAASLAAAVLLAMAILTLFDVLGRNLLRSPVPGATELTEIGLVAVTFLLYPMIAFRQSHITVDLFDQWMRPLIRRALDVTANLLGAAVFGGIAWQLWKQAARVTQYGDVTAYLRIPLGPVIYFMAVLSALAAAGFVLGALWRLMGWQIETDPASKTGLE